MLVIQILILIKLWNVIFIFTGWILYLGKLKYLLLIKIWGNCLCVIQTIAPNRFYSLL